MNIVGFEYTKLSIPFLFLFSSFFSLKLFFFLESILSLFLIVPYLFSQDVSQEAVKEDCSNHMMKINVIHPNVAQENQDPVYVSVLIEGTEVLEDCISGTNACLLLMGVIYAVNLSYPLKLKYTFEVFQKPFLELDVITMSPKVQFLHNKLLA